MLGLNWILGKWLSCFNHRAYFLVEETDEKWLNTYVGRLSRGDTKFYGGNKQDEEVVI